MANLRKSGSVIEFNYITHIIGSDEKIIKKNCKGKITCDIDDIRVVDYFFDEKGSLNLNKCKIYHDPTGWMIVNEPYEIVHKLKMTGNFNIAGFQIKKERKKTIKNYEKYGCNYTIL